MLEAIVSGARQPLTPDDYIITRVPSGQDTLQFVLDRADPAIQILEERGSIYETTTGQTFWISGIDAGQSSVTFAGKKDLTDWEQVVYPGYVNGKRGVTALETIRGVTPSGWTVEFTEEDELQAQISMQGPTALEVVEHCQEVYGIGAVFDNRKKRLTVHFPGRKTLGPAFLVDTANLRAAPEYKGKATGLVTRLYAQGAEGMTFAAINGGKAYVECYDYTQETIAGYWRDERYTVPEHLLAAAKEKVKVLAQPERSWSLKVCDLHAIDPVQWPGLELELFSVVKLIDRSRGSKMEAQITEIRSYPHHPERNEISISVLGGTISPTAGSLLRKLQKGTLYEGLELTVDQVRSAADQAASAAEDAQKTADEAQTAADTAQTAAQEAKASVQELADSILLTVENGQPGSQAQISLSVNGQTQQGQIDLTGAVTFTDLSTQGNTAIHGGNIQTGTIAADRIDVNGLFSREIAAENVTISGATELDETTGLPVKFPNLTLQGKRCRLSLSHPDEDNALVVMQAEGSTLRLAAPAGDIELVPGDDSQYRVAANGDLAVYGGLSLGGQALVDFPVEEGTSGIWHYRKWASGAAECWGTASYTVAVTTQYGQVYWGGPSSSEAYPFRFSSVEYASATVRKSGTPYCWGGTQGLGSTTTAPRPSVWRGLSSDSLTFTCDYYTRGTV